jgi:hypothetical protein
MTIRDDRDEFIVRCNGCGSEQPSNTSDFLDFIDRLKREGWKIKKDGDVIFGEWKHYCPDCVK